jgi:sugar-phosphatase
VGGLRSGIAAGARTVAVTSTTPAGELSPLADALVTSLDDLEVRVDGEDLVLARRGS